MLLISWSSRVARNFQPEEQDMSLVVASESYFYTTTALFGKEYMVRNGQMENVKTSYDTE